MAQQTSGASKEAVVFILDTSPSMNQAYVDAAEGGECGGCSRNDSRKSDADGRSRLSYAKVALEEMILELMLQSKCNEAGIILLKTAETEHHLYRREDREGESANGALMNLTEMSPLRRPSVDLVRRVRGIVARRSAGLGQSGSFCHGIILAADAMYGRTHGKRFRRKIVLFTDAMHEVNIDRPDLMDKAVNDLRDMDCPVTVVGLNFGSSAYFRAPAAVPDSDNENENDNNSDNENDGGNDSEPPQRQETKRTTRDALVQRENEKLVISLTKWTGGEVLAPSSLQEILAATKGRRIPKSAQCRTTLIVAPPLPPLPPLAVPARISLRTAKANLPTLKREALRVRRHADRSQTPQVDANGEAMTSPVVTDSAHWDPDDPDKELSPHQRITAYSYGSDLVPIGPLDMQGLARRSMPCVTVLGYVSRRTVPVSFLMGPTRVLAPDEDSLRAQLLISALAQALHRLGQYAVCTFVSRRDADPLMGLLVPFLTHAHNETQHPHDTQYPHHSHETHTTPHSLLYVRMPFGDDWQNLTMMPLQDDSHTTTTTEQRSNLDNDLKVCEHLIDSLMLPPDVLRNESIPNPAIRAFHKTVMRRAIDPDNKDIVSTRPLTGRKEQEQDTTDHTDHVNTDHTDPMATPPDILERAKDSLETFRNTFPLNLIAQMPNEKRKKKFWSDIE